MITIKTPEQIAILREAGKIHAEILDTLASEVKPGMTTKELDARAHELVTERGAKPSFLGYRPDRSYPVYQASLCTSRNNIVVHGIPNEDEVIKQGDILSYDLGLEYKGMFTDSARTIAIGSVPKEVQQLIYDTHEAMMRGIAMAQVGNTVGHIGYAIQSFNKKKGYGNVRELAGHGVGCAVHEDPFVPNYGTPGEGAKLKEGMVIAIEPMFTLGSRDVNFHDDGYTVSTKDGSLAAHVEHTVLITKDGPEILTLT